MGILIGELARKAGVKAQTIRYYEALGLLSPVLRSASGYRSYDAATLDELGFIRKAQSLGFSLEDIRLILDVARAGRAPCERVLAIAEKHLAELDERISQLRELRTIRSSAEAVERGWRPSALCVNSLWIN